MKPNILFILIDDMGWRDLGCYGSAFYETPHIDRLAAEGMRFTGAYAACPVCSPSRASILSGKYPATVGVTDWIDHGSFHPCYGKLIDAPYTKYLPLTEKSLASALKEGGYQTWHVGKWHLGQEPYYPKHHGFDVNIGGCELGHPHHGYFSPYGIENLPDGPEGEYLTDRLTEEAIRCIENNDGTPFFLNLWHYAVHTPIECPAKEEEKYRQKRADTGLDDVEELEEGEFFPTEQKRGQRLCRRLVQSHPGYGGMLENLDKNIGRLLEALERTGQSDNTIVIFTSDNGGLSTAEGSPTCNSPLSEGKGFVREGGVRVPLCIKWPSMIEPGSLCDTPVTGTDFYPTLLEAAGLPLLPEQHCDGVSLAPLFRGEALSRDAIYWHYPHYGNQGGTPAAAVRMGDYKLIRFFEGDWFELYNLAEDIEETTDLSGKLPGLAQSMSESLSRWLASVKARIPKKRY